MTDSARLDGQVAIVTGAAQGIGRGIAQVLSEAGASIVIGDIQDASDTVETIRANGGNAISTIVDTANADDANRLVDFALSEHGRVEILVNNAAIDAPSGNVWDLPNDEWQRTIDVNLSGVFYCSRAVLKPMLDAGKGCIINMSSQSAHTGAKGMSPAYNASKAGVIGITVAFSSQVAEFGIRVNALMPGLIISRDFGWSPQTHMNNERSYPIGAGTPRDIGEAVRYLASPAARWVTGTAFPITGGHQRGQSFS